MAKKSGRFFIQQFLREEYVHGGVGGTDAERVLLSKGFQPIIFPHAHSFSIRAKLSRLMYFVRKASLFKKWDTLVFLWPMHARLNRLLVSWLARKKKNHLVCFIADINGLKDGDPKTVEKELKVFKKINHFIVHNEAMKKWLIEQLGGDIRVAMINFFDFLANPVSPRSVPSLDIVFAGNLEKSPFLSQLHLLSEKQPGLRFHIYGQPNDPGIARQSNVIFEGSRKPYELPDRLHGSFGLLWDGDSIDGPGGSLGDYMKYISHHKLSLYILAKLPIIVPSFAASAPLVEKYNIGFTISNLHEISEKINALPPAAYYEMQNNMAPLAVQISEGERLVRALNELEGKEDETEG